MAMQRDFWVKNGILGEMSVQKDFWIKNGILGEWTCNGLLGKIGVLGEMACKGTFRLKMGFGGKWACKKTFGLNYLFLSCFEDKYICFNHLKMKTKAHYQ